MSEQALFETHAPMTPKPTKAKSLKRTERQMLDAIHQRHSATNPGNGPRFIVAEHVRNQAGFGGSVASEALGRAPRLRTIDAIAIDLWPSTDNAIHGFEVKVSRSDWLSELKDMSKSEAFRPYLDYFWLVAPDASIVRDDLPDGWGLMVLVKSTRSVWNPETRGFYNESVESLRIKHRARRNPDRQPMPIGMTAAWLRASVKTSERRNEVAS